MFDHLTLDALRPDLIQFIYRTDERDRVALRQARIWREGSEDGAVIDADRVVREAAAGEDGVIDRHPLGVRDHTAGADDIRVALPELAETSLLRAVSAPNRAHVIALEGKDEIVRMHRDDAGEWNRQIVAHPNTTPAVIGEAIEQFLALIAELALQDFDCLQDRRVQWLVAESLEDAAQDARNMLLQSHLRGQIIAESTQDAGLGRLAGCCSLICYRLSVVDERD